MKLVLSQYLRTLRERDEFDRLLPELVSEMGYVPLVKPQAGIRQFGVDFPAAGKNPEDGVDELLLFVIKQGDIGRREWSDNDPTAVRPSINEVLDVYLRSHVPAGYEKHRKVIVVATTGDLVQDTLANWSGFTAKHTTEEIKFDFWGADRVAGLLEQHLLDENLFDADDRSDLRKSLALAGDAEYQFADLRRLLQRQLGLKADGTLDDRGVAQSRNDVIKALSRVHLAARVCAYWADAEGERRQGLWVLERTILWCFHRVQLQDLQSNGRVLQELADLWTSYAHASQRYYELIRPHLEVRDGMSGYCREGAEYAVVLFEQIGLLATIGLAHALTAEEDPKERARAMANAHTIADALVTLLRNHSACASPRLDNHSIDISLALTLLTMTGHRDAVHWWLSELTGRLNFVFLLGRHLPVGSDSFDDLVELDVNDDEALKSTTLQTSWLLATIASWCAVLELDDLYAVLARGHAEHYSEVGAQLWHPGTDWRSVWYFGPGHHRHGTSEAPYAMPLDAKELRARIQEFNASRRVQWEEHSPALAVGLWPVDFLACRHFRTPVPATVSYRIGEPPSVTEAVEAPPR
ncbi:MAG: hypothetical protein ACLGJD_17545 [Gammaproteobacteria bacterium]